MQYLENNEQALLSCFLKNGDLVKETVLKVQQLDYVPHQKIFEAMLKLSDKDISIDIISVIEELGTDIVFIGGVGYLTDLHNIITNPEHFKTYEKYVLEEFQIRKSKELLADLGEIKSPRDIQKLHGILNEVNDLLEQHQEKEFNLVETLVELNEDLENAKDQINGIPTGFKELDMVLDGLLEEELNILAARPSVGKTAFALGIATNVCEAGHFVDFFSLEMSDKSLLTRMLSSIGRIQTMKLKSPTTRFNDEDWGRYTMAQGVLSKYKDNLNICDQTQITVQEIRSKVKQSIRKYPNKRHLVVIDYLTLIQGSGRKERHLEVGEISRNLKRMSRDLKVPVLLLAQLNRAVEQRQNKRPLLSDLRDSGEIEQDADKILFLHRDDYYDKETENKNIIDVITAKSRNGSLGTVQLAFIKEYNLFVNLERRYDNSGTV